MMECGLYLINLINTGTLDSPDLEGELTKVAGRTN